MKHLTLLISILLLNICIGCQNPSQQQKSGEPTQTTNSITSDYRIPYNSNDVIVPQSIDSIDSEQLLRDNIFYGEKFFKDTVHNQLLAINISYPRSNIYMLDLDEKILTNIFKDYGGYFKNSIFHGLTKYNNQFHEDTFTIIYDHQDRRLSLKYRDIGKALTEITYNEFLSIFKNNMAKHIITSEDNLHSYLDEKRLKSHARAFRIKIDSLSQQDQKIVRANDYYFSAILNTDSTITNLKSKNAGRDYHENDEQIITKIIPQEIAKRKLAPATIFNQPLNMKINLRIEFSKDR